MRYVIGFTAIAAVFAVLAIAELVARRLGWFNPPEGT